MLKETADVGSIGQKITVMVGAKRKALYLFRLPVQSCGGRLNAN